MKHTIKKIAPFITAALFLFGCKKNFDQYYERPSSLEPPIYQQLQARGNFSRFLALVDKAGYKQTLSNAGYWTIFAPTDSAFTADAEFQAYLAGKGISSFEAIDKATAQSIVQYLLVFNGFEKERLDDYQSNLGWVPNQAFKRRTAYYTGFYKDTTPAGQPVIAVASNRNNTGAANSYFNASDNNNKHIPFFTQDFFSARGLAASDYTYFYPNSTFSGFNIDKARVVQQDIAAENGVIHVLDRVVTPLFSLDQYLRSKPEYREFRNLLEKFMVQFVQNDDATSRYRVLNGGSENVFVKVYSNLLAFSPNNENFFKLQDNDAQQNGWSLFVPKNDVLQAYIRQIEGEGYGDINKMPLTIIADLLNSHMWQNTVWPSKFQTSYNFLGEPARFNAATDIFDKKMLSNGVFYGTNKVNQPNVFATVFGKAYLNPKFTLMTRLLNENAGELRNILINPSVKYTLFMTPDEVLRAKGYDYDQSFSAWTFNGVRADSNRTNLLRMIQTGIIETRNNELNKFQSMNASDSGIIASFNGEYIRYRYNNASPSPHKIEIFTAGTRDRNTSVFVDSIKQTSNGQVVYLNNLLYFTHQPLGVHLQQLAGTSPNNSEYNFFYNYLINSSAYDATAKSIVGIAGGSFYTVFAPSNNAIRQAIREGVLPGTVSGTTVTPTFNPTSPQDRFKVESFIFYHVLDKRSVIADQKDVGAFPTLLKNANGDPIYATIQYSGNTFQLRDFAGRVANMIPAQSNHLSNRTVIHLMDNYLKYY